MIKTILKELGDYFSCEPDLDKIKRSLYKNTACGAWIEVEECDERGPIISMGSIIEGLDCGVVTSPYIPSEEEDQTLEEYLDMTIEYIEGEVDSRLAEVEEEVYI